MIMELCLPLLVIAAGSSWLLYRWTRSGWLLGLVIFVLSTLFLLPRESDWRAIQPLFHLRFPEVDFDPTWNILYHLGGNSPWIRKIDGVVEAGIEPPAGCSVDQVVMMSRHAERYPTLKVGIRMLQLYNHIQTSNVTLTGGLAFANDWEFLTTNPAEHLESLVATGPYAGTLDAFSTGVKLKTRYNDLITAAVERNQTTFWASDSERVIDTAKYFAAGFFGIDWQDMSRLQVIPETSDRGADTLTPGDTCFKYAKDVDDRGHDYGRKMLLKFRKTYLPKIATRLHEQNPNITFTHDEIYAMQELCGFDTIAKGSSPWCDVFTRDEWEAFEYARDVIHYYRAGPGNPYSGTMGWLWLNATAAILRQGPQAGPLFLSFAHDGDIVPMIAALNLFPQKPDLPATHVLQNRAWRTSSVVPMGGRIILERLSRPMPRNCWYESPMYPNHVHCDPQEYQYFVRVNVNDGIVTIPGCDDGPGGSCPLDAYIERIKERGADAGDFRKVCGLKEDAPKSISFLHQ